jgi:very-short-patch-repair endonuclease
MTDCERRVWYYLRARRFEGWKFRRQVPIDQYIVDFLCEEAKLVVELDGGQHTEMRRDDERRSEWLRARGYSVVRFWNNDVVENIRGVLEVLAKVMSARNTDPLPGPLPREREIR